MPKFAKTLLFFLLLPLASWSQTNSVASLRVLLEKATHDTTRLQLQNKLGLAFYDANNTDSALFFWKAAYAFGEENRTRYSGIELKILLREEGEAASNVAFVYTDRGMTAPAMEYNFKSLQLREKIDDEHGIAESLNNIAFIYSQQHDTAKALEYYTRSAAGYEAIHDYGGVAYTQINRARIYSSLGKDSIALDLYLLAIKSLSEKADQHRGYSSCLNNIGNIYTRMGRYADAMRYLNLSLKVRQKNNDESGISGSYISIGKLYQQKNMPDSALFFAGKGFELAQKTKSAQNVISSSQLLSDLYNASGDYEHALNYYRVLIATRDSVSNEEAAKQIVRQQMSYEYAKEKEVDEVKLSRQRGYTIGGFSALGVVAVLLLFVYRQRNGIARAKKRSDELLLNILPAETAEELKATGTAKTKSYANVTVMFTDFKNFTQTAELLSAEALVELINFCYGEFDRIVSKHNVEKIKTIGDSYMCAGGLPVANETHAVDAVSAAVEMLAFIKEYNEERKRQDLPFFDIRIGLHTGPVVAGIVGTKKFAYDIWGDAVNIASRMESSGEPGKINISESTYAQVKHKFECEYRGKVKAKNKGEIDMYFVSAVFLTTTGT